jgi:hypothetical protein
MTWKTWGLSCEVESRLGDNTREGVKEPSRIFLCMEQWIRFMKTLTQQQLFPKCIQGHQVNHCIVPGVFGAAIAPGNPIPACS